MTSCVRWLFLASICTREIRMTIRKLELSKTDIIDTKLSKIATVAKKGILS